MPFMFMIAGYSHGIKEHFHSGQTYIYYLRKYIIDIYIPCLIFSYTYWFSRKFFVPSSSVSTESFHNAYYSELLTIPFFGYSVYWFICALFFVKIVHIFLERYVKHEYMQIIFWVSLFIIINLFREKVPSFFGHFTHGLYFHAGYILKRNKLIRQRKLLYGIIFFLLGMLCFHASYFLGQRNILTSTGASMFMSLSFFQIFYAFGISYRFLVICGIYSMVIYALHSYIATPFRVIFRMTGLFSSGNPFMLFTLSFVLSLAIPLVIVWLYKNVKCLNWIEYIFYPGRYKREKNPLP